MKFFKDEFKVGSYAFKQEMITHIEKQLISFPDIMGVTHMLCLYCCCFYVFTYYSSLFVIISLNWYFLRWYLNVMYTTFIIGGHNFETDVHMHDF